MPDSLPNYGGAVCVIPYIPAVNHSSHAGHSLELSNCSFHNNPATIGGAVFILHIQAQYGSAKLYTDIIGCTFTNNIRVLGHGIYN